MNKNLRDPNIFENGDENGKWTICCTVLNRRKHQGVTLVSYMLKKTKMKRITCRNKRAIRRFAGDSLDNGAGSTGNNPDSETGSTGDTQTSGGEPTLNAITASCIHTGIRTILKDTIHPARLSNIGCAVTEQEATEISGEDSQYSFRAEQKRSVSFSRVCQVVTQGEEKDEVQHHLFFFFQNRPKDDPSKRNYSDVGQANEKDEQGQGEVGETEGHGGSQISGSLHGTDWGRHLNGKDDGLRSKTLAQWPQ